jgi:putative glutamine amidotransferase
MHNPIIGVTPLWDAEKSSIWMFPGYMDSIILAGGVPIILPLTDNRESLTKIYPLCDGYLFTGGQDVSPKLYEEVILPECGEICEIRDSLEQQIFFDEIIDKHKPVLGICRGIQILNVLMGGSLYQHLTESFHTKNAKRTRHSVKLINGSQLLKIIGENEINIVSNHHQGIKRLSPKVKIAAVSEDSLVEAFIVPEHKFTVGVQWHPECDVNNLYSRRLFEAFITACK